MGSGWLSNLAEIFCQQTFHKVWWLYNENYWSYWADKCSGRRQTAARVPIIQFISKYQKQMCIHIKKHIGSLLTENKTNKIILYPVSKDTSCGKYSFIAVVSPGWCLKELNVFDGCILIAWAVPGLIYKCSKCVDYSLIVALCETPSVTSMAWVFVLIWTRVQLKMPAP